MRRQGGTTLLELMVAIVIVGLLMAAGLPSLAQWLNNVKVRGGADALQNGFRLAQAEAIRRNDFVTLKLTSDTDTSAATATGTNWTLVQGSDGTGTLIQTKAVESTPGLSQAPDVSANFTTAGMIVFNALGGNDLKGKTKFVFSKTGADRSMAVFATPGGRVRLCDPSVTTAGDTRKCE